MKGPTGMEGGGFEDDDIPVEYLGGAIDNITSTLDRLLTQLGPPPGWTPEIPKHLPAITPVVETVNLPEVPAVLQLDTNAIQQNLARLTDLGIAAGHLTGSAPQAPGRVQEVEPVGQAGSPLYPISRKGAREGGILFTPDGPLTYEVTDEVPDGIKALRPPRPNPAGESHHVDGPPEGYITRDEVAARLLGDDHLQNLRRDLRNMIDLTRGYDVGAQVVESIEPIGEIPPAPQQQPPQGEIS